MTKQEAWATFVSQFLGRLEANDSSGQLHEAFAKPIKGSKAEAVIMSMRSAFSTTFDATETSPVIAEEPSGVWDTDFKEPW